MSRYSIIKITLRLYQFHTAEMKNETAVVGVQLINIHLLMWKTDQNGSQLQSIAVHVPSVVAANLTPALLPVIILEDAELLVDAAVWAH